MSDHPAQQRAGTNQSSQHAANSPSVDGHIDDLVAPYVLGALDEATTRGVETHIAHCPICQRFVNEARQTASFLPFLATPAIPRSEVKTNLFARIAQAETTRNAPQPTEYATPNFPLGDPAPVAGQLRVGPWQSVRRRLHVPLHLGRVSERVSRRPAYAATFSAVPLLVALTVVGMWAMSLHGQLHDAEDQVQVLDARVNTMNNLVAENTQSFYEYQLTGGPAAPQAGGKIYADPDQPIATLMVWNLERTTNQPYQIFVEQNGRLVPVGQLTVDSSGKGTATIRLNGSLAQYRSIHIKAESTTSTSTNAVDLFANPSSNDALSTEIDARVGNMSDTTAP